MAGSIRTRRTAIFPFSYHRQPGTSCARCRQARRTSSASLRPRRVRTRIRNMLEVRLLYRNSKLQQDAGADGPGAHRRAARERARYRSLTNWPPTGTGARREGSFTKVPPGPGDAGIGSIPGGDAKCRRRLDEAAGSAASNIEARQPFLDLQFNRVNADGSRQSFRISGEPMFDRHCSFVGYRHRRRSDHEG